MIMFGVWGYRTLLKGPKNNAMIFRQRSHPVWARYDVCMTEKTELRVDTVAFFSQVYCILYLEHVHL